MTNELKEKLTEKLKEIPEAAAEYIVYQLERIGELGRVTAEEIVEGTLAPWAEVKKKARKQAKGGCAMIDNLTVFRWIDEALHIDGVVKDEERAAFVPSGMSSGSVQPAQAAISAPSGSGAAALGAAPLGARIDLDALFD